jgi:hypothetical protein
MALVVIIGLSSGPEIRLSIVRINAITATMSIGV